VTDESSDAIMRSYTRTNGTVGLVDTLYSTSQQNIEASYQREMESYADGNRLFRICSVRKICFEKKQMT
jgi:hypothetical protein